MVVVGMCMHVTTAGKFRNTLGLVRLNMWGSVSLNKICVRRGIIKELLNSILVQYLVHTMLFFFQFNMNTTV